MATLTDKKLIPCCTRDSKYSIEYNNLAEIYQELHIYDDGDGHFDEIWETNIPKEELDLLNEKYPLICSKGSRHSFNIALLNVK